MSKVWYMTVGYPGGEYAGRFEGCKAFVNAVLALEKMIYISKEAESNGVHARPCPPDLVQWLDDKPPHNDAIKVPGGWLYSLYEPPAHEGLVYPTSFVPVAGAAGITVLEAGDE